MKETPIYQTSVVNKDGIFGFSYVKEANGLSVKVSSPLDSDSQGTNPEQLLGLALATCLNATLEAEQKRRGISHQSTVTVEVSLHDDLNGYQFVLNTLIRIPHISKQQAEEILLIAKQRCPMVKLLEGSNNISYHLIKSDEINDGNANIF